MASLRGRKIEVIYCAAPDYCADRDNYGLPYPPIQGDPRATNYPIFCLDGWRRVALLLESF